MAAPIILHPGRLRLSELRDVSLGAGPVSLNPDCWNAVAAAREVVAQAANSGVAVYGINTGFGSLADTHIPADQVSELQHRLVLSHAAGVGPLLPDRIVRLILALKIANLARGHSGVRREVIEALLALLNAGVYPCVPAKGSVGASGDLAPLAHLAGVLIGSGEVRIDGKTVPAANGLAKAGLQPLRLEAKEGLALLNGTQVSTALLIHGLIAAEDLFSAALVAGALSVDAALGSDAPFDTRLHAVGGHPGQRLVAQTLWTLLRDSRIRGSHVTCAHVQDPYSLRCQPQIMGACLDTLSHAARVAEREANGVSDNPLVFPDSGDLLSGGNFHAEAVAFAADTAALALAEIGALSERRVALLIDNHMSGQPAFLVADPGLNSGFMIAQVTAAALVSENRSLAHPSSIDSLPTSANQEDHVSMATYGAYRLEQMVENAASIVAIELLAAIQGVNLLEPLTTGPALWTAMDAVRERAAFLDTDRPLSPDINAIKELVRGGRLTAIAPVPLLAGETSGT